MDESPRRYWGHPVHPDDQERKGWHITAPGTEAPSDVLILVEQEAYEKVESERDAMSEALKHYPEDAEKRIRQLEDELAEAEAARNVAQGETHAFRQQALQHLALRVVRETETRKSESERDALRIENDRAREMIGWHKSSTSAEDDDGCGCTLSSLPEMLSEFLSCSCDICAERLAVARKRASTTVKGVSREEVVRTLARSRRRAPWALRRWRDFFKKGRAQ